MSIIKTKKHYKKSKNQGKTTKNSTCNVLLPGYVSFENKENYNANNNKRIIDYFKKQNSYEMQQLLRNDYYEYISKNMHDKITLNNSQKYIGNINLNTLLQDKIYNQMIELVNLNKHKNKHFNNFYESAKKKISLETARKYINELVQYIDECMLDTTKNNLWKMLAFFNKNRIISGFLPLSYDLSPNEQNTTKFAIYLTNKWSKFLHNLIDGDTNTQEYMKLLNAIFTALLGKNHGVNIQDIIDVHHEIYVCLNVDATPYEYNIIHKNNEQKYNFNYEVFFKELGYTESPEQFIVKDLVYFEKVCKLMIDNWNTPKWRGYWIFICARQIARFTEIIYNTPQREFFVDYFYGKLAPFTQEIEAIRLTLITYNRLLSDYYIEKYNDVAGVNYISKLITDLKMVFYRIIQNNTWLDNKTKTEALLTIENLKIIVGKTLKIMDDPDLNYTNDDIWHNITLYYNWKHSYLLTLDNTNVINIPTMDWNKFPFEFTGTQIFVPSIKYYPTQNAIYVPASFIQIPMMDLQGKGLIYNLANIGFLIAKELYKSIDDDGCHYNYHGNLYYWWKNATQQKYSMLKINTINEYLSLAKKHKIQNVNIKGNENEIIAFINGFHLCCEYLKSYYAATDLPHVISISKIKTFFSFFVNANKEDRKYINMPLPVISTISKHILINLALSKNKTFDSIYDIKKGDNMYSENKKIIW